MAIPTPVLALGAIGAIAGGYYIIEKWNAPSLGQTAGATAAGEGDGCAQGTADAKAGLEVLNPTDTTDNPPLAAAAKASGDAKAYLAAYAKAYDSCFSDHATTPAPAGGGSPAPAPKPGPVPPPPGAKPGVVLDKAAVSAAYQAGCKQGALDGYAAGFDGSGTSYLLSGASGSGNAAAYTAAYKRAFSAGYAQGAKDSAAGMDPPGAVRTGTGSILASGSIVIRTLGINLGCVGGFDTWLAMYLASTGAKVAGARVGYTWGALRIWRRPPPGVDASVGYTWGRDDVEAMGGGPNRHPGWPAPQSPRAKVYRAYPEM
jgi:hypothetical protein